MNLTTPHLSTQLLQDWRNFQVWGIQTVLSEESGTDPSVKCIRRFTLPAETSVKSAIDHLQENVSFHLPILRVPSHPINLGRVFIQKIQENNSTHTLLPIQFWKHLSLNSLIKVTHCCCSAIQSCHPHDPMDCSMPYLFVLHYLLTFAEVHVHCIDDAIQPSHPLMPSFPCAVNLSQHHGLFQWVNSSYQIIKILKFQLQNQSFEWVFRINVAQDWLVWSLCCPRDSQESSLAPQFEGISSLVFCFFMVQLSHNHACPLRRP